MVFVKNSVFWRPFGRNLPAFLCTREQSFSLERKPAPGHISKESCTLVVFQDDTKLWRIIRKTSRFFLAVLQKTRIFWRSFGRTPCLGGPSEESHIVLFLRRIPRSSGSLPAMFWRPFERALCSPGGPSVVSCASIVFCEKLTLSWFFGRIPCSDGLSEYFRALVVFLKHAMQCYGSFWKIPVFWWSFGTIVRSVGHLQ
jgi:hypothetical protein